MNIQLMTNIHSDDCDDDFVSTTFFTQILLSILLEDVDSYEDEIKQFGPFPTLHLNKKIKFHLQMHDLLLVLENVNKKLENFSQNNSAKGQEPNQHLMQF